MSAICLYVYDMYNVSGSRRILCLYGFGEICGPLVHVPQASGEYCSSCPI